MLRFNDHFSELHKIKQNRCCRKPINFNDLIHNEYSVPKRDE